MVSPLLSLMLLAGAAPCVNCDAAAGAWSPYYCPHRQVDDCPGQEVYAQTSPWRPHPARTAWMYRYTYKYGFNYSRPTDFRLLYDFPWYRRGDYLPRPAASWDGEMEAGGWTPAEASSERAAPQPHVDPPAVSSQVKGSGENRSSQRAALTAQGGLPLSRQLR